MNIMTILNKLKEANLVSKTEEGLALFSDCFTKFGISLLLLNDEDKFNRIVSIMQENNIPLQKANGIYALRIFAVDVLEIENVINEYSSINELNFLRENPNIIAEPKNVHFIFERMRKCQSDGISYKNDSGYNMEVLLNADENIQPIINNTNDYLKKYLHDPSLIDKLERLEGNEEEDVNVVLELQKVENKICEEYLFPIDDGWKIVINNKEVNSFQEVKNTINTITKLNLPVTFDDALIIVLFYKTHINEAEIDEIVNNVLFKEGMK